MSYTPEELQEHRRRCTEMREDGSEYQPTRELVLKLVEQVQKAEAQRDEWKIKHDAAERSNSIAIELYDHCKIERDAAEAIIARLPKTADGVPVTPDIRLHDGEVEFTFLEGWYSIGLERLYSTREAALAAKGGGK